MGWSGRYPPILWRRGGRLRAPLAKQHTVMADFFQTGAIATLLIAYCRQAEDTLRFYAADAALNGLIYPRHEEEMAVSMFVRCRSRIRRRLFPA